MAQIGCNPVTGRDEDYYCRKCIDHRAAWGDIKITMPCTVCAMRFGGSWVEGGDVNGVLPGRCAITSLVYDDPEMARHDLGEGALDHQVVLGFVQFALYNHLRWRDIIDQKDGKSKEHPECSPQQYRTPEGFEDLHQFGYNWYWWKAIPHGTKLPKRLVKTLRQILEKFPMMMLEYEGDLVWIPQNEQVKSGVRADGEEYNSIPTWEGYFWNTFVEPAHTTFIFSECIKGILGHCDGGVLEVFGMGLNSDIDYISQDLINNYEEVPWEICQCVEWGGHMGRDRISRATTMIIGSMTQSQSQIRSLDHSLSVYEWWPCS